MMAASKLTCVQQLMIPTAESPKPVPHSTNAGLGPEQPDPATPPGFGVPPKRGAVVNAWGLMNGVGCTTPPTRSQGRTPPVVFVATAIPRRHFILPLVPYATPDWQLPVTSLQLTGVESSARSTGPVAGSDVPYNRVAWLPLAPS